MKAIIIDNEPNVVEGLSRLLSLYCPEVSLLATADSVASGRGVLLKNRPDLVFLDVELGDGTGMELLQSLDDRSFQLVFITAYEKYAVDAFRFSAIEFLLKPIDPDDLILAVDKAKQQLDAQSWKLKLEVLMENYQRASGMDRRMVVKDKENIHILELPQIVYCEASGGYTIIYLTENRKILSSKSLKNYEELLADYGFYRVHHSFLVNQRAITRYDRADCVLELKNGAQVPVSSRKKDALAEVLGNQLFLE